jgi:hypothetical protein
MREPIAVAALIAAVAAANAASAAAPTADDLCKFVASSSELRVVYTSDPADAPVRFFDIYGVGETSAGNPAVFGRQISGYSPVEGGGSAPLPDWRTFRLDRLKSVEDAGTSFTAETPAANETRLIAKWSCGNPVLGAR